MIVNVVTNLLTVSIDSEVEKEKLDCKKAICSNCKPLSAIYYYFDQPCYSLAVATNENLNNVIRAYSQVRLHKFIVRN